MEEIGTCWDKGSQGVRGEERAGVVCGRLRFIIYMYELVKEQMQTIQLIWYDFF